MRGRSAVLSLVAIAAMLLVVSAVAFAHEGRTPGTRDSDELTMSDGNDRVFARGGDDTVDGGAGDDRLRGGRGDDSLSGGAGDDRLKGGQGSDHLDGGEGDDYLNGRGDGRAPDEIVCGAGYDVAVLGRGDVIVVKGQAANDVEHPVDVGDDNPPEPADDGCEKVKQPKERHHKNKGKHHESCAANSQGCDDESVEEPCAARYMPRCGDPEVVMPEPDEPVEEPVPDEPGEA